jgi:hypothetical protein
LIHSPLVGPLTVQPLADELRRRGWTAITPDLRPALAGPRPLWRSFVDAACAATVRADVIIGHSGAGVMLPSIAEHLRPARVVFVDAVVPGVGASYAPSERFAEFIASLADGPLLPPWHEWWGPETMAALVPDGALRQRLADDTPRVPRSFYADAVDLPARWPRGDGWRYVQLSPAYDEDCALARSFGWPTDRLDGHHLDLVTRPAEVCDSIIGLIA